MRGKHVPNSSKKTIRSWALLYKRLMMNSHYLLLFSPHQARGLCICLTRHLCASTTATRLSRVDEKAML